MATPHDWLNHRFECAECGHQMQPDIGEVTYDFDTFHIVVAEVPMAICSACGHRIVPGRLAIQIDDYVRDVAISLRERDPGRAHVELGTLSLTYKESEETTLAFA